MITGPTKTTRDAIRALKKIEDLVDKIRYAMDPKIEQGYIKDLLALFDPETGDYRG